MSAFDEGATLFKAQPELLLAEVWRRLPRDLMPLAEQQDFVAGYQAARRQRDEYEREKQS